MCSPATVFAVHFGEETTVWLRVGSVDHCVVCSCKINKCSSYHSSFEIVLNVLYDLYHLSTA